MGASSPPLFLYPLYNWERVLFLLRAEALFPSLFFCYFPGLAFFLPQATRATTFPLFSPELFPLLDTPALSPPRKSPAPYFQMPSDARDCFLPSSPWIQKSVPPFLASSVIAPPLKVFQIFHPFFPLNQVEGRIPLSFLFLSPTFLDPWWPFPPPFLD